MQESILKTSSPSSKKYAKVQDSRHKTQEKQGASLRIQDAGIQAPRVRKNQKGSRPKHLNFGLLILLIHPEYKSLYPEPSLVPCILVPEAYINGNLTTFAFRSLSRTPIKI